MNKQTGAFIGASAGLKMHYSCLLGQTDYIPHISFVGSFIIVATRIYVTCMVCFVPEVKLYYILLL
jgi:hypothetical protein